MKAAMTVALTPLSGLYGLVIRARRSLYERGALAVCDVSRPVISVGNITMGGTGKTPLVARIVADLSALNKRICVLTRGYGRPNPKRRVVVSDGRQILTDPFTAGDEAFLLAEGLIGQAAVISDADRVAAAHWAVANLKTEVFVLDDGFQNLRIKRNLDIVTIDATNPWGNGKLLPAGILRERPEALSRANCIVITRADNATESGLYDEVLQLGDGAAVFRSQMKLTHLRPISGTNSAIAADQLKESPAAAFCAIGNPQSFFSLLRRDGYKLSHTRRFRDHHRYVQADIDRVVREAITAGAQILLTTAKDDVKLRSMNFALPVYAADIEIEIENAQQFSALLRQAVSDPVQPNKLGASSI